MQPFVAAIGPINVDILYSGLTKIPNLGEEVFADKFDIQLDGGATAIITALARLGVDSRLGTFLSDDFLSNFARSVLEKNHIDYRNFYHSDRSPIIVTSIATFPQDRCFITYSPDRAHLECSDEEVYNFYSGAKVCKGIVGHDEVFKKLSGEGTRIVFDVFWDDNLNIEDFKELLKYVYVFTPNEKEALKMTGKSTVTEALEIIGNYVEYPIIKLGSKGCVTKTGKNILHVPAIDSFKTVDTTGAGDNFLAGIIYGLIQDWSIEQCMKMGNITGGFSTTELGCSKAYLTLEKAMEFMNNEWRR